MPPLLNGRGGMESEYRPKTTAVLSSLPLLAAFPLSFFFFSFTRRRETSGLATYAAFIFISPTRGRVSSGERGGEGGAGRERRGYPDTQYPVKTRGSLFGERTGRERLTTRAASFRHPHDASRRVTISDG